MKIFNKMSAQKKLVFTGMMFSTILIVLISALAMFSINDNLNNCYRYFGQIIAKSLAIESVQLTRGLSDDTLYNILKTHSMSILETNEDIASIEFHDTNSNVIYSSKKDGAYSDRTSKIYVSAPLIAIKNRNQTIVGSVSIGLSGKIIDEVKATTKISLTIAF